MKVNQFIALMAGFAMAGFGATQAKADPTVEVPEESQTHSNTSQNHPVFHGMSKEQLVDHLAQAAEAGCRCCGRCQC